MLVAGFCALPAPADRLSVPPTTTHLPQPTPARTKAGQKRAPTPATHPRAAATDRIHPDEQPPPRDTTTNTPPSPPRTPNRWIQAQWSS
jgi:hypothetical protein